MSSKLGTLTLDLVARIGQFIEPMKSAERQAKSSANNMQREFEDADKGISFSAKNIGASIAGVAASYLSLEKLITTQRTFDKLNAGLITATGSAEGATKAFDSLQKFAKETPYGLEQSVEAFIKLTNLGLKPSEVAMTSYGNTAAAMGKDLSQMIEAVADATTGEFERLKEFGIKASQENGKVALTFKGQTTTIRNNAKEIEKYLLNLGNVDFSGAMANRMKTLDGSIANLEDTIDSLFLKVSQSGIGDAIKAGVDSASLSLETVGDNLDTVADLALVVGAIFAGKFSASMLGSARKTIAASVEQKQALLAEQTANVQLLGIQAQRSRQNVALALTEVNLARADFNSATTATARAAATQRLTAANIALAISEKQAAVSTSAYTIATTAATGATSRLAAAKALLLGLTGGWVGLGITVASVAAGYLMMKGGADESTKSLRENNESVDEAIKKYKELDEVKRRAQLVSEKANLRDLAKEYDDINSKLITTTYSFSRHNDMTTEQSKQVNALVAEYKKTGNIDEFSKKINALNFINQISKDRFNTLGGSVKDAGDQFKNQKTFVDQMAPAVKDVGDQAKQTAGEVAGLTEEIKKLLGVNTEGTNKSNYLKEMVNLKVDPKLAEMLYEARKTSDLIGSGKPLDLRVLNSVMERWKADQGLNKTLEERAKIEERNKKIIDAQGNAMKVNALVASNAAKANATALESAKNLPKGLLSAVNMVESPHSNFAKSGSGAGGPMQFMPPTADRYKVDIKSVESSYRGASNYLKDLLKMFDGDLENALRAYNWGEGNMQNYLKYGSGMKKENGKWQKGYFADKPMPKETREYSSKVMGYMAGASGTSFNENYSFDDWVKEQEKLVMEREKREKEQADKQKQIALEVATYKERINTELADKIKEINEAGFGEAETKRLTTEYQKRAAIDIQVSEASHADKISGYSEYLKSEEQLLNESFARRQRDLKLDLSLTADDYKAASLLLEGQRKKEVDALRRDEKLDVLEAKRDWMNKGDYAREYYALIREEILATANYSPEKKEAMLQQAVSQQNLDESYERDNAIADYQGVMGYEESPLVKQFEVLDKMRELDLLNEEAYQNAKLQLQAKSTASYMEGMFGGFASLVNENSKTYAVLFAAQKAFAVAQAMLNIPAAYSKAYDAVVGTPYVGPYIAPAVGAAAAALQVAQAASIKGVSLSGMAHDGIDNIPKEGTWLLDGGERVLNPNQNKDLTNYLSQAQSNSGQQSQVNLNPNFVIVDEREKLGDYLYGPDGKKAFVKFFKQNRKELGLA